MILHTSLYANDSEALPHHEIMNGGSGWQQWQQHIMELLTLTVSFRVCCHACTRPEEEFL